jgi:hypothetical protein
MQFKKNSGALFKRVFLKLLNVMLTYASVLFFEMFDMVSFSLWYLSGIMGIFPKKNISTGLYGW